MIILEKIMSDKHPVTEKERVDPEGQDVIESAADFVTLGE